MKYYDLYEPLYRKIRTSDKPTWDAFFDANSSYEQFWTRRFIDLALPRLTFAAARPRALELGCGAGQACCYLAAKGFAVSGIDISATAVAMAQQHARERSLDVRFECANVATLEGSPGAYDLILDGNCMHCVVFDEERAKAYAHIRHTLAADGYFLVSTMAWDAEVTYPPMMQRDEHGVLWAASDYVGAMMPNVDTACEQARELGGRDYLPYRRVLAPAQLREELARAGFDFVWERIEPPRQKGVEAMFQAIMRARGAVR